MIRILLFYARETDRFLSHFQDKPRYTVDANNYRLDNALCH